MARTAPTRPDGRHETGLVERFIVDGDDNLIVPRDVRTQWGRWWSSHELALHTVAVVALLWGAVYLVWRIGWSWDGANPVLWVALLLCELGGWASLVGLTWFSWSARPVIRPRQRARTQADLPEIDVYVCTYDEPVDVVMPTLLGCASLTVPHTTYLLDDGRRPVMAELAARCGAIYLTRPDNSHAKAGNINAALERTTGDLVFILDADHVPFPDALEALVGYFDDPEIAVVQTPHGFYNDDSFQHYDTGRHEQSVFYEVILPGKDRHGGAFWCGSGALIRRDALLGVGGVATDTIAEDFHTTIKLQRAGWSTRYHHEHLIQGVAPHDLAAYLLQRDRWARGNLSVFHTPESPFRARELTLRQRLSYLTSLLAYLAGPTRALLLAVLVAVLWTGALPIKATWFTLGVFWAPATALMIIAGSALTRGYMRIKEATHFELLTAEIHLRALRCLIRPSRASFRVTPKEGVDTGGYSRVRVLRLLVLLAVLLVGGVVVRILAATGAITMAPLPGIAAWIVPVLGVIEARRVLRSLRFVGQREQFRLHPRVPAEHAVTMRTNTGDVRSGTTTDISIRGVGTILDGPIPLGMSGRAEFAVPSPDGPLTIVDARVRSTRIQRLPDGRYQVGFRIERLDPTARARLMAAIHVCILPGIIRSIEPAAPIAPVETTSRRNAELVSQQGSRD